MIKRMELNLRQYNIEFLNKLFNQYYRLFYDMNDFENDKNACKKYEETTTDYYMEFTTNTDYFDWNTYNNVICDERIISFLFEIVNYDDIRNGNYVGTNLKEEVKLWYKNVLYSDRDDYIQPAVYKLLATLNLIEE